MTENETQLKVISDRTSDEHNLLANVQQLQSLCESRNFWTAIINDPSYSITHRRVAFIQYFIRHSFNQKVSDFRLSSLNLAPSEFDIRVIGLWTGPIPVQAPHNSNIIRISCRFSEDNSATIYLSIVPKTGESDLVEILFGKTQGLQQTIADVAATERLDAGDYINWKRWQQGQVFEYL